MQVTLDDMKLALADYALEAYGQRKLIQQLSAENARLRSDVDKLGTTLSEKTADASKAP